MTGSFGWTIVVFTLISKIILLPISIWVQKNSIKMVKMQPEINHLKTKYFGDKDTIAEEESRVYKKYRYNPFASIVPLVIQIVLLLGVVEIVKNPELYIGFENINYYFFGFDLRWIAIENQYGMMVLSVGLSLYLGTFVTAGVGLYWTVSNLLAVLQQWLLNICINPKKHVNYKALEVSRAELQELQNINKTCRRTKEQIKREKVDYKRFFNIANKKLVFYSESSGFYKCRSLEKTS